MNNFYLFIFFVVVILWTKEKYISSRMVLFDNLICSIKTTTVDFKRFLNIIKVMQA